MDFIDFYTEFDIPRTADCNEIRNKLGAIETDYLQQRAVCITTDQMDVIQKLLDIINSAIYNLANEGRRKKYDKKLEQMAASGQLGKQQISAKNDYEQALIWESKGKPAEAIILAERAINANIYNVDAYALIIRCCFKTGDHQKAIDIAEEKAIRIYPDELCFRQYAARIRTIHRDYDGASQHIGAMLRKDNNNSAGHIEKAVRMLYMSEDDELTQDKRLEYKHIAEKAINQYIAENPNDNGYRNGVATALIGLSDHHYSLYEGVNCKIIDSEKGYNSILQLHEWAGKISDNDKIHNALNDIRKSGQRKFNTDNSKSLLCLTAMSLLYISAIFDFLGAAFSNGSGFSCENVLVILCLLVFCIIPWLLLIKVSFRPLWKIDRIRYTGHVDTLERVTVAYGLLVIIIMSVSWAIMKAIIKFVINAASRE